MKTNISPNINQIIISSDFPDNNNCNQSQLQQILLLRAEVEKLQSILLQPHNMQLDDLEKKLKKEQEENRMKDIKILELENENEKKNNKIDQLLEFFCYSQENSNSVKEQLNNVNTNKISQLESINAQLYNSKLDSEEAIKKYLEKETIMLARLIDSDEKIKKEHHDNELLKNIIAKHESTIAEQVTTITEHETTIAQLYELIENIPNKSQSQLPAPVQHLPNRIGYQIPIGASHYSF